MEVQKKQIHIGYEDAKKVETKTMFIQTDSYKKYIVSKYDPIKEAKSIVEKYEANKETLWILLGYGLGYVAEYLLKANGKDTRIIIIEPSQEEFEKQLGMNYKTGQYILEQENVYLFFEKDASRVSDIMDQQLGLKNVMNTNVINYPVYTESHKDYYEKIIECIAATRIKCMLNYNTVEKMAGRVVKNTIENIKYLNKSYDIRQHKEKYQNTPAVVVASGPSLSKNIEYLKNFEGLIIVVGRSLDAVLEQGVRPDFVATLDPQDIVYDTFKGHVDTEIPILAATSAHPKLIGQTKGAIYFVQHISDNGIGVDIERIAMGGSVATLCISAACYMGCNPIVLIGQDLAYTDMKYHAESCSLEEDKNNVKEISKEWKLIEGYYGDQVYSINNLISYKNWIEVFIKLNEHIEFINATEGGALIKGANNIPFKEVVQRYSSIKKVQIQHIQKLSIGENVADVISVHIEQVRQLQKLNEKALKKAKELREEYVCYKGMRQNKIAQILYDMDEVDNKILKLEKSGLVAELFNKHYNKHCISLKYQQPLEESKNEKGLRISQLNCKLYEALQKGVEEILNRLETERAK